MISIKMYGKRATIFFSVSIFSLIFTLVLTLWIIPKLVNEQIQKKIRIDNTTEMFDRWRKIPMPLLFKVYVFNVTNADEVNAGRKPKLSEIGPYVYREYIERRSIEFNNNDTVRFMMKKTFVFDEEASGGRREDDEVTVIHFAYMFRINAKLRDGVDSLGDGSHAITTYSRDEAVSYKLGYCAPNAAVLTVSDTMASFLPMLHPAFVEFFSVTDPFLTIKVKDLFFDGLFLNCSGTQSALGLICGKIRSENRSTMRPSENGDGFFWSMFGHLNRTESGPYEIYKGTQNINDLGQIASYKGKSVMPEWDDPYCGKINGTDATVFAPIDEANVPQRLYSFEPDICRSMYVSLSRKTQRFNMTAYYYEMSSSTLASKSANPDNKCFCKRNWSANHDGCLIMGVLNLMPCQGSPAIVSLPHFYQASEELLDYIQEGVAPDKERHNTYVYLDPMTGVVLEGVKRLQFNIEVRNMPSIEPLAKVQTGLFPLLWIEEGAVLPPNLRNEILQGYKTVKYVDVFRWILLTIAAVVACVSMYMLARANSLTVWPRNTPVSFVLQGHGGGDINKVH